jgi:uncharacterized phiE125 gp8 family phage protein
MWYDELGYYGCDPRQNWETLPSITSPPTDPDEPISLSDAKGFIKILDGLEADAVQDDQIVAFCRGARRSAEFWQGKDFIRRRLELSMDYWPGVYFGVTAPAGYALAIELRKPLISVESVSYKDSDGVDHTLDSTVDYAFNSKLSVPILFPRPGKCWPQFNPWPSGAITVQCTTGYAPTDSWWHTEGDNVLQGMRYLVHHFYHNRAAFTRGIGNVEEYPFTVTQLFNMGAISRP